MVIADGHRSKMISQLDRASLKHSVSKSSSNDGREAMWESEVLHGLIGVLSWFLGLAAIVGLVYFASGIRGVDEEVS